MKESVCPSLTSRRVTETVPSGPEEKLWTRFATVGIDGSERRENPNLVQSPPIFFFFSDEDEQL